MNKYILFALFSSSIALAKSVETPYLDVTVPDDYTCASETGRFVCQRGNDPKLKDSILTMVFKRSGPQDTLDQYAEFIKRPMSRVNPSGPPSLSEVSFVRTIKVGGFDWVEAKHIESELANYVTYYWATVRPPVAMVVTYSVEKSRESSRMTELTAIRDSMRTKAVQYSPPPSVNGPQSSAIAPQTFHSGLDFDNNHLFGQKPIVVVIGFLLVVALIFVVVRR